MQLQTTGVHYHIREQDEEYIEKKLKCLRHSEDTIVTLDLKITKEARGSYTVEAQVHFRWKNISHIHTEDRDIFCAIDKLFGKLENKIVKEKEKIQDHRRA